MINKLVVDNLNITLNEKTVLPFTYTFSMAGVHEVRIGLDNTNEICAYAFKDCTDLSKVKHIPEKITMIKRYAFENCVKLKQFDMPAHIEYVGPNVFDGCDNLREINFESPTPPRFFTVLDTRTNCYIPNESKFIPINKEDILEYYNNNNNAAFYKKKENFGGYGYDEVDFESLDLSEEGTQYYIDNWLGVHDHYNTIEERYRIKPTSVEFLDSGIEATEYGTIESEEEGDINFEIKLYPENTTNSNIYLFSSNERMLTVSQERHFKAGKPGSRTSVYIYACTEPYYDNTYCYARLRFTINPPAVAVDLSDEEFKFSVSEINITNVNDELPTLININNVSPVFYSSSNAEVATIESNGTISIKGNGTTTITAEFRGNNAYNAKTVSYELNINIQEEPETPQEPEYDLEIEYESQDGNIQIINNGEISYDLEVEYESQDENIQVINED